MPLEKKRVLHINRCRWKRNVHRCNGTVLDSGVFLSLFFCLCVVFLKWWLLYFHPSVIGLLSPCLIYWWTPPPPPFCFSGHGPVCFLNVQIYCTHPHSLMHTNTETLMHTFIFSLSHGGPRIILFSIVSFWQECKLLCLFFGFLYLSTRKALSLGYIQEEED